ncbi:hypothetical protein OIU84_000879 [Salix udensis]|uniref:GH18 domain-containing protein n=1 Tax=Salix udensis TaxID=889485 RepID=A0AAD6PMJ3_9ROSI|nr:hypothetical protein OIU84_000879 [Salix udensis]
MASHRLVHLFPIILLFTIPAGYVTASPPAAIKAAYWPSWSKTFPPSAIDTTLFTHILYAFLVPSNVTFKFEVSDSTASLLENFHRHPSSEKPTSENTSLIWGRQ